MFVEFSVSSSVSRQWVCTCDAPLPSSGSRWPRFPAFSGTIGVLRLPALHVLRLIGLPAGSVAACAFVSATALPPPCRPDDRPESLLITLAVPPSDLAHGQEQDLPGSLAPHPVTLPRSTTPDDPSRLAARGAAGAAPRLTTLKASSLELSRLTATLRHPLSTLHDAHCRSPCKTPLPAGGLRLYRAGVEPAGQRRKGSDHLILLPRTSPGARSMFRADQHLVGAAQKNSASTTMTRDTSRYGVTAPTRQSR